MIKPKRKCDGCSVCCEGHLSANIYGYKMHRGYPCHFLDKGEHKCSIYKDRPKDICVPFKCVWLQDPNGEIPEWMKPNISGALITTRKWDGGIYWQVHEAQQYTPTVLYWIVTYTEQRAIPIELQINQIMHLRGPKEFQEFMIKLRNTNGG